MNAQLSNPQTASLVKQLDAWLPKSIRMNPAIAPIDLAQARGMLAILIFSILLPLLVLLTYVVLQLTTNKDFTQDIIALMGVELLLISQHVYFQSYGNLRVTAAAYSIQYLFSITGMILISGGWHHSPLLILLVCSPLIAYMTMGTRIAIYHVALVFVIVTSLLWLQMAQIQLKDISRAENYDYTHYISWAITLIFVAIFMIFTEKLSLITLEKR